MIMIMTLAHRDSVEKGKTILCKGVQRKRSNQIWILVYFGHI